MNTNERQSNDAPIVSWKCPTFRENYRMGAGDALDAVYRRHVGEVAHIIQTGFRLASDRLTFIRGVRSDLERDDLVQEVFSRAFAARTRANFDPERGCDQYLFGIARHVLVDWHRANRRRRRLDSSLREAAGIEGLEGGDPRQALEPWRAVEKHVSGLDRRLKGIYEWRLVGGRTQRETALALGLSRQNVRTLERRLRDELKNVVRKKRRANQSEVNRRSGRW